MHIRRRKEDSDASTESSGNEDGLDVPGRLRDEDHCPSPPKALQTIPITKNSMDRWPSILITASHVLGYLSTTSPQSLPGSASATVII